MEFLEGGEPASVRKESCNLKPILLAALGATGRAWLRDVHLQNAQGSESKKKEIIIKFIQIQTAGKNKYVSFSLITIKIYKNISDNLTHFFLQTYSINLCLPLILHGLLLLSSFFIVWHLCCPCGSYGMSLTKGWFEGWTPTTPRLSRHI